MVVPRESFSSSARFPGCICTGNCNSEAANSDCLNSWHLQTSISLVPFLPAQNYPFFFTKQGQSFVEKGWQCTNSRLESKYNNQIFDQQLTSCKMFCLKFKTIDWFNYLNYRCRPNGVSLHGMAAEVRLRLLFWHFACLLSPYKRNLQGVN